MPCPQCQETRLAPDNKFVCGYSAPVNHGKFIVHTPCTGKQIYITKRENDQWSAYNEHPLMKLRTMLCLGFLGIVALILILPCLPILGFCCFLRWVINRWETTK